MGNTITNDNSNDNWIGIEEAAQYMWVTKETIRNWIKKPIYRPIR